MDEDGNIGWGDAPIVQKSQIKKWKLSFKGLLILVLPFLFLNGLIVGSQYLYSWYCEAQYNKLNKQYDTERSQLKDESSRLYLLYGEITTMKQEMDADEAAGRIESYNSKVDTYNANLADYNNSTYAYNQKLPGLNNLAHKVNKAAEKIPKSIWYIIPIPLPGHHITL